MAAGAVLVHVCRSTQHTQQGHHGNPESDFPQSTVAGIKLPGTGGNLEDQAPADGQMGEGEGEHQTDGSLFLLRMENKTRGVRGHSDSREQPRPALAALASIS